MLLLHMSHIPGDVYGAAKLSDLHILHAPENFSAAPAQGGTAMQTQHISTYLVAKHKPWNSSH